MNNLHIPHFPNQMSCIYCKTYLPKFKNEEGDDVVVHLIKIHMHICRLGVEFKEDLLIKMFMDTLEGKGKDGSYILSP